jgi:hypothetical protein
MARRMYPENLDPNAWVSWAEAERAAGADRGQILNELSGNIFAAVRFNLRDRGVPDAEASSHAKHISNRVRLMAEAWLNAARTAVLFKDDFMRHYTDVINSDHVRNPSGGVRVN